MNKIWIFIIFFSITFGVINGNGEKMVDALFDVPQNTLELLISIGSMLVIYNGLFKIAQDANVIKKLSVVLKRPVGYIFKIEEPELKELISASIIANFLGLGPANMAIALKVMDKLKDSEKNKYYNITMYLVINISSMCILPLSTLAFREKFDAMINIAFIPLLFVASFITTIIGIIIVKVGRFNE